MAVNKPTDLSNRNDIVAFLYCHFEDDFEDSAKFVLREMKCNGVPITHTMHFVIS